jgi:hypothetical protein
MLSRFDHSGSLTRKFTIPIFVVLRPAAYFVRGSVWVLTVFDHDADTQLIFQTPAQNLYLAEPG